jgi:hypothetical protein
MNRRRSAYYRKAPTVSPETGDIQKDPRDGRKRTDLAAELLLARGELGASTRELSRYCGIEEYKVHDLVAHVVDGRGILVHTTKLSRNVSVYKVIQNE